MTDDYIWLVTEVSEDDSTGVQRGLGSVVRKKVQERLTSLKEVKLSVTDLEAKMNHFLQLVGRLFQQANQQVKTESGMQLKEVELQVEVSAEGEVKLVAGGKAAAKGAITLKFERNLRRITLIIAYC